MPDGPSSRSPSFDDLVARFTWTPPDDAWMNSASAVDRFVRLACLTYDHWRPSFAEKARRMLEETPDLARANVHAAAAAGDVAAVRRFVERDPGTVNAPGDALGWEPLLHACYSRLNGADAHHSTLDVARVLLEHGADPNAGFLWGGSLPPFTALAGAFGEGEAGVNRPPHEHRGALARLLLDAGADPNDGQALYNRHFKRNDDHLELLLSRGLGRGAGGPWFRRFGERMQAPAQLLVEELWAAARKNYGERVRLLVEHGADVNTPGTRDGRTPYEAALRAGNTEIAAYLLRHGAREIALSVKDRFAAACVAGNRSDARALLAESPGLLEELGLHGRVELVHRAVEADRPEGIRLMADLGFEIGGMTSHGGVGVNLAATPMHNAAWMGNLEMVRLFLELGADPAVRDPNYRGTPLDWAEYNGQREVAAFLRSRPGGGGDSAG